MSVSDIKISELTVASTSTNSDVLPVVQNNETKQMTKSTLLADVNTSITNIKNGTNINDFAGVESALNDVEQEQIAQNSNINSNTTAINGIRNGSTINSFAGVESALNTKVDKVAGKGLSTNDFDNTQKAQIQTNKDNILLRSLITETGNKIQLEINNTTYVLTAKLYDKNNNLISTSTGIDLPLETMVVGASYDSTTKEIVLTLKNGSTVRFSVADLVSGLQSEITVNNKLASDLVDDTNQVHKFATASQLTQIATNTSAISGIENGTSINDFAGVENALDGKQSTIDLNHKLNADLVNDSSSTNKFVTAEEKAQISENETDIEELQEENTYLQSLVDQIIPTETLNGTDLTFNNTIVGKLKTNKLIGNCEQDSYSGYNIAPINTTNFTQNKNSISSTSNSTGGRYLIDSISLKANVTYYFNLLLISKPTTSTTFAASIDGTGFTDLNYTNIDSYSLNNRVTYSYTPTNDCIFSVTIWGNNILDDFEFQYWACEGTNNTTYEPYVRWTKSFTKLSTER